MFRLILLTSLTLVAFASNSLLARAALLPTQNGVTIDAASFTVIRIMAGALMLWVLVVYRRRSLAAPVNGSWMGGFWLATYAITFSFAYLMLDAGLGALLLFGAVQVTMIGRGVAYGERPPVLTWMGVVLAFAGLVVLVRPGISAPPLAGSLLMALAGMAWGAYSIIGGRVKEGENHSPVEATAGNFIRALPVVLLAAAPFYSSAMVSTPGVVLAMVSGAITSGLGYVTWYAVLPSLTATRASVLQLTVPLIAAAGGVLLLGERISLRFAAATMMILGGVALTLQRRTLALGNGSKPLNE